MTGARSDKPVRIGIAGLGQAGAAIVPAILRHPGAVIAGAAEPDAAIRSAFSRDFVVGVHASIEGLCDDPSIDVIYVATPTHLHCQHTLAALGAGKHVVVEKPMAVNLEEAGEMVAAAEAAGRHLIVGHSQSFEPATRAMRDIVAGGTLGRVRMAHNAYYTDWLYRPRTPEELDTSLGGGSLFRQGIHQVDLLRWICGGGVRSVRASVGRWDRARPADGSHTMFLDFEDGTVATAVFSGYDHFSSAELTFGIGEAGRHIDSVPHAAARRLGDDDASLNKRDLAYGGSRSGAFTGPEAGFYGLTIVSCEGGDIRQSPGGLTVYGNDERQVAVAPVPGGRDLMLDEAVAAVRGEAPPLHDGRWGMANLEVCLAALESSRTRAEVFLKRQVPTPGSRPIIGIAVEARGSGL